jgi:hypothetical protein
LAAEKQKSVYLRQGCFLRGGSDNAVINSDSLAHLAHSRSGRISVTHTVAAALPDGPKSSPILLARSASSLQQLDSAAKALARLISPVTGITGDAPKASARDTAIAPDASNDMSP